MVIACFVGARPQWADFLLWLDTLNAELNTGKASFSHTEGRNFFCLETSGAETTKEILTKTPFKSQWGMCIFQEWIQGFNPEEPEELLIPMWITLRKLPREYRSSALEIARSVDKVIGQDGHHSQNNDLRFCVGLKAGARWETDVTIKSKLLQRNIRILIDYDNLPIRCRRCWATDHQIRDCPRINPARAGPRHPAGREHRRADPQYNCPTGHPTVPRGPHRPVPNPHPGRDPVAAQPSTILNRVGQSIESAPRRTGWDITPAQLFPDEKTQGFIRYQPKGRGRWNSTPQKPFEL